MGRHTILLVEDDSAVREAVGKALTLAGYQVVPAADQGQAIQGFTKNHVDFALVDLNLGNSTGWETVQKLSHLSPLLPIIVMSARPDQFAHASACSVAALMEKPFDFDSLVQKLKGLSATSQSISPQPPCLLETSASPA